MERLSRALVRALRSRKIRSNEDGWVRLRLLARYVKAKGKDVLATVSHAWRDDEEIDFERAVRAGELWINVIESRRMQRGRAAYFFANLVQKYYTKQYFVYK